MGTTRDYDIRGIARLFSMHGDYQGHAPCGHGHINDTFEVRFNQAGVPVRYIVQRINHDIFREPQKVMQNIERVTAHIAKRLELAGIPEVHRRVLTLVRKQDGGLWHEDAAGNHWRGYLYIEGAEAHNHVNNTAQAEQAARAFGEFQKMLADLPVSELHETIPWFHHARRRYIALMDAVERDPVGRRASVEKEIAWVQQREANVDVLLNLLQSGELPERITHNDTKINNVMLDCVSGEGLCVMDLDTVMPGTVLYDFGDLVRTTTISTAEDERDPSKVEMRMHMFDALVRGYLSAAHGFLVQAELDNLAFCGKLITQVIGMRFLTDYLNGDVYFKTSRPGHNLDRFRVQAALVESIERQENQMQESVRAIAEELAKSA